MTWAAMRRRPEETPRLTAGTGAVLVAAALVTFAVAYAVGDLFGRAADSAVATREVAEAAPAGTPDVTVRAKSVAFDTRELVVTAAQPVTIQLENEDAGILHNIAVYRNAEVSALVARGQLFDGPNTRQYRFDGFPTGTYYFQCDLHPSMNGTLVAR